MKSSGKAQEWSYRVWFCRFFLAVFLVAGAAGLLSCGYAGGTTLMNRKPTIAPPGLHGALN